MLRFAEGRAVNGHVSKVSTKHLLNSLCQRTRRMVCLVRMLEHLLRLADLPEVLVQV